MKTSDRKKQEGIYCCAFGCTSKPHYKLGGLCSKHYTRKRKELDPVAIRYNNMKSKSKTRAIVFSITLDQFRRFCNRTGYIIKKGRRGMNATVDRRCNVHGYHIWNVQLLTHRQNASKGTKMSKDCPF